jgi:hypothetical protein
MKKLAMIAVLFAFAFAAVGCGEPAKTGGSGAKTGATTPDSKK